VSIVSEQSGVWPDVVVPVYLDGTRRPVRLRPSQTDEDEDGQEDAAADEEEA
jgi:hypothetical protein